MRLIYVALLRVGALSHWACNYQETQGNPLLLVISKTGFFDVHYTSKGTYGFTTHLKDAAIIRPDTSHRQRRRLPPCPLSIALVPLKCSSINLQFPHRVPFTKEKMPWCPCPFKNEAYRLKDTSDKTGTQTHTQLIRNDRAWIRFS